MEEKGKEVEKVKEGKEKGKEDKGEGVEKGEDAGGKGKEGKEKGKEQEKGQGKVDQGADPPTEEPAEPTVNITSAPSGLQEDPPSQGDIAGGPEDQHRIEATDIPAMFPRGFFDAEDLADDAIQACQPIKHHANHNDE